MLIIRLSQQRILSNYSWHTGPGNSFIKYSFSSIYSDEAQQALIAHNAMMMIRYFDPTDYYADSRSIRNLIIDRAAFKNHLKSNIWPFIKEKTITTAEWIDSNFEEKNYQAVLQGFQLHRGAPYDSDIWPQTAMNEESINHKIILFPVSTTKIYFRALCQGVPGLLTGMKGTGKSFSFFMYSYLCNFKVKYLVQTKDRQNMIFKHYKQENNKVTQICYLTIKDQFDFKTYFFQVAKQFYSLYPQQQIDKDILQFEKKEQQNALKLLKDLIKQQSEGFISLLQQIEQKQKEIINLSKPLTEHQRYKMKLSIMLKNLRKKALSYGIKIVCAIDDANIILRPLRKLEQFIINYGVHSIWKQTQQYKKLLFYQQLFNIFMDEQSKFTAIILNGSQDFEVTINDQLNKTVFKEIKDKVPTLCRLTRQGQFGAPEDTKYAKRMSQNSGKIELYNIFWFEILKFIKKQQLLGKQDKIYTQLEIKLSAFRAEFQDLFGLNKKDKQMKQKQGLTENWKNQTQHLAIRQAISKYQSRSDFQISFLSRQDSLFKKQNPNEQEKALFRKDIQRLKEHIQQTRKNQIILSIIKYINDSTNYQESLKRIQNLRDLLKQAQQYSSKKQVNRPNYSYDYFLTNHLSTNERQAFVEAIKCGYFQKKILRFNMNPKQLKYILRQTTNHEDYLLQVVRIVKKSIVHPKARKINTKLGKFLEKVSFPIFMNEFFSLKYIEHEMINNSNSMIYEGPIQKPTSLFVEKTCPILGLINEANTQQIFKNLLQLANANINKYVGGFPVQKLQNSIRQNLISFDNNVLFDNIILKRLQQHQGSKPQYDIILYDWTLGRPESKSGKDFRPMIDQYLYNSKIRGNLNCKLLIVAQDFLVKQYINKWKRQIDHIKQFNQLCLKKQSNKIGRFQIPYQPLAIPTLPTLYLSYSFVQKIDEVLYNRNVSVGVASFNENSPFQCNQRHKTLTNLVTQCYKQLRRKYNRNLLY